MKFTLSWLKEHLETYATLDEICERLTAIGLEVEDVDDKAAYKPFVIAKVLSAEKHPEADRLKVLSVDAGDGKPVQIVSLPRRTLGGGAKFEDFHESLRARGVAHPFETHLSGDPYPPLNETARAAQILLERYRKR